MNYIKWRNLTESGLEIEIKNMIELKNPKINYEIKELLLQEEMDRYVLSWSYQKGNCFLIILSSGKENRNSVKDMISEMDAHCQELLEGQECSFGSFKAYFIREPIFASQDKRFWLKKSELEPYFPAKLQVFSCEQEKKTIFVYKSKEEDNISYIPLTVKASLRYKKIWFSRKKRCLLRVNAMKDYQDGMLLYRVGDQSPSFPLTIQCLGREMEVTMLRNDFLELEVMEKYNKLYEVRMSYDKHGKGRI